jgi:F-type H+-transporting ATPase subunit a
MHHEIILPTFGLAVHTAVMIYLVAALVVFSLLVRGRFTLVPGKLQSVIELVVEGFATMVDDTMGPRGRKYLPIILTIVVLVFMECILGLVPGLLPPTADLNTTAGLALVVFVLTHIIGFKEHGIKYVKHFMGPIWWMSPLMIPIEIIGHFARPLSLSLRLFGNIMGHERIVGVLLILMPIGYPLLALSTVLGVVTIILQTFIFVLLSMMYLGGALEEAH